MARMFVCDCNMAALHMDTEWIVLVSQRVFGPTAAERIPKSTNHRVELLKEDSLETSCWFFFAELFTSRENYEVVAAIEDIGAKNTTRFSAIANLGQTVLSE